MKTEALKPKNTGEFERIAEGDRVIVVPDGLPARVAAYASSKTPSGKIRDIFSSQIMFSNSIVMYAENRRLLKFDEQNGGVLLGLSSRRVLTENDGKKYDAEVGRLVRARIWHTYLGVQR